MFRKVFILLFLYFWSTSKAQEIRTTSGIVRGKSQTVLNKTVNLFFNIPYAEPPIGKLRFGKPVPLNKSLQMNKVIDGTKQGKSCYQSGPMKLATVSTSNEDCLILNVWSPEMYNSNDLKPVMFFIHGGAYQSGSNSLFIYDGKVLPTYDVVVVSANYRLGPFGWLYGGDESAPGNLGLYDHILALHWVKENIHSFGGNPDEITIFGESAGSWSVSALVVSPLTKGLFKRAILESGAVFGNKNTPNLLKESAILQSKQMAKHYNCSDESQWLECLRKVDPNVLNDYQDFQSFVIHDTEVMPVLAQKAFKTGAYRTDIDIMAGVMSNEGSLLSHLFFPKSEHLNNTEQFIALIKTLPFPELDAQKISEFYLKNVDTNSTSSLKTAFYEFLGHILITCPTYKFAKTFAESAPQRNVYFYKWTHKARLLSPILGCGQDMGVCHASDLEYVFGLNVLMNAADKQFSEYVMKLWTNFAKNSKPLDGIEGEWPRLIGSGEVKHILRIKEMNPLKPNHMIQNLFDKTCDGFWNSYYV